jgi:hypothetical protein
MVIGSKLKKIAILMVALPVISLSAANTTIARGEEFNREGGSGQREGNEYKGGEYNRGGEGQSYHPEGGDTYNRNTQENYNRNYSGEGSGNAGSAVRGYSRGYEQGSNNSGAYSQSPIYVQPQQPYDTEPPVNQSYQYQYPN